MASTEELSIAQKFQQEHAQAAEGHHVTVEDVPDEELKLPSGSDDAAGPPAQSDRAAGKQKETASAPAPAQKLDTQSRELFPELGGPKSQPTKVVPKWNVLGDKTNGNTPATANGTSRAAAPSSGVPAPAGKPAVPSVALPGRHVEHIVLEPQHMKNREQLKRPLAQIIQDINRTSRAQVKAVHGGGAGGQKFEAAGPQEAAQQALKELVKQIGSTVCPLPSPPLPQPP